MKSIAVVTLSCVLSLGALTAQELSLSQLAKIRNYNHTLIGKIRYQQRLKRMATTTENEAEKIAKEFCKEEVRLYKLTVKKRRLFYIFGAEKCKVNIDALDGSLVEEK